MSMTAGPDVLTLGPILCETGTFTDDSFEDNDTLATAAPITEGAHLDLYAQFTDPDCYSVSSTATTGPQARPSKDSRSQIYCGF